MRDKVYSGFKGWKELNEAYGIKEPQPKFIFAFYDSDRYEGSSIVITSDDAVSFRINDASHCSCYGLSECWSPTGGHSREAVKRIMGSRLAGTAYRKDFRDWFRYLPQPELDDSGLGM